MALYKFEGFVYDSTKKKLSHKGQKVLARPKALSLLHLLITNRDRIVTKAEIMKAVWNTEYARDHLLFQLVSELRRLPTGNELVRTQPNEGYQWNVDTKVISEKLYVSTALAATVIMAVCGLFFMNATTLKINSEQAYTSVQLPAYQALTRGIIALENGEDDEALEWFQFAHSENPNSIEASIFLADTLFRKRRFDESLKYLQTVFDRDDISAYDEAAASTLLSRIYERQGRLDDAIQFAKKSVQTEPLKQCSTEFVERRVRLLQSQNMSSMVISPITRQGKDSQIPASEISIPEEYYIDQCEQLEENSRETSLCLPWINDGLV